MQYHLLGISLANDVAGAAQLTRAPQEAAESARHRVEWIVQNELAAASVAASAPLPTPREHAQLLQDLHQHVDILPVRYGGVLPNESAVRHMLSKRRDDLSADLDRLRQTGEMGLRIDLAPNRTLRPPHMIGAERSDPGPAPVRYLDRQRHRYALHDRVDLDEQQTADRYASALDGLYRQWRRMPATAPGQLRLSFLVARHDWDAFRSRVASLPAAVFSQRPRLFGPWPPYSFVSR